MKLLVIGVLAAALCVLVTVTLLGYRHDQVVIRWFPGTGIAGKIDVLGATPTSVLLTNLQTGQESTSAVDADGTFIAPLPPDSYDIRIPGDARTVMLHVPNGDCLDLVLDYRIPLVTLKVPREGWPLPSIA